MSQVIEHTGRIQRIDGRAVQVLITQQSACSGCHAKAACTAADAAEKVIDVLTDDAATLHVGDEVVVCVQRSAGMRAVLLAFVAPFLLILLTLFLLRGVVANEAVSGTIALSTLIPYYIILSLFKDRLKSTFQFYIKKLS